MKSLIHSINNKHHTVEPRMKSLIHSVNNKHRTVESRMKSLIHSVNNKRHTVESRMKSRIHSLNNKHHTVESRMKSLIHSINNKHPVLGLWCSADLIMPIHTHFFWWAILTIRVDQFCLFLMCDQASLLVFACKITSLCVQQLWFMPLYILTCDFMK